MNKKIKRPAPDLLVIDIGPVRGHLQAVALEAPVPQRKTMASKLAKLGVNHICRAGQMQEPPLKWNHDGQPLLANWVHWK